MGPTIATTLGACFMAERALDGLLPLLRSPKVAYHAAKLHRLVAEEARHFAVQRDAYIKQFGVGRPSTPMELATGSGPTVVEVTPEHRDEYARLVTELSAVAVTIPWGPLSVTVLPPDVTGQHLRELIDVFVVDDGTVCPVCGGPMSTAADTSPSRALHAV